MKPETRFNIIEGGLAFVVVSYLETWWPALVLLVLVTVVRHRGYLTSQDVIEEYKKLTDEAIDNANKANATTRQLLDLIDNATEKKE